VRFDSAESFEIIAATKKFRNGYRNAARCAPWRERLKTTLVNRNCTASAAGYFS